MAAAKERARQRILKNRFDRNYRTPEPRLMRTTVANVGIGRANQPYSGDMGQFRKGTVVIAENIGTDANPYPVAKHAANDAGSGRGGKRGVGDGDSAANLTTEELNRIIREIGENLVNPPAQYNDPSGDIDETLDRDDDDNNDGLPDNLIPPEWEPYIDSISILPSTSGTTSHTFTIPSDVIAGSTIILIAGALDAEADDLILPSGWDSNYYLGGQHTTYGGTYPLFADQLTMIFKVAAGTPGEISTDAGTEVEIEYVYSPGTDPYIESLQAIIVLNRNGVGVYRGDNNPGSFETSAPTNTVHFPAFSIPSAGTKSFILHLVVNPRPVEMVEHADVYKLVEIVGSHISLYAGVRIYEGATVPLTYLEQPSAMPQTMDSFAWNALV